MFKYDLGNYAITLMKCENGKIRMNMRWNSNTGQRTTHASSMFGWKILFMNPEKGKEEDYTAHEPKQPVSLHATVKLFTYWWWFERVFLRKIDSHLPHTTLVRCCAHKNRQMSHFFFSPGGCHFPSVMHANECKRYKLLICLLPEMLFLGHFFRFYAVMYFSPGEFSSKSLHIIHWHQRVTEWDCVNVWCSPRIAVCVRGTVCADFRLKAAAVNCGAACRGWTEEKYGKYAWPVYVAFQML